MVRDRRAGRGLSRGRRSTDSVSGSGGRVGDVRPSAVGSPAYRDPRMQFWPDALSYADLDVGHIVGHRQVPDAYLAGVALSRGGRLATLDTALSEALSHAVLLIPQQR